MNALAYLSVMGYLRFSDVKHLQRRLTRVKGQASFIASGHYP
jgi:hypothetical protein